VWYIGGMKIKKATINIGRTVNLGNFESARFDLAIEAEVESKEDIKELEDVVSGNLDAMIGRRLSPILKNIKDKGDFI
tara:strand:- start:4130 stop:4363 length:234 start_codon:yes stop_codon:yes gene_type:complete